MASISPMEKLVSGHRMEKLMCLPDPGSVIFLLISDASQMTCPGPASPSAERRQIRLGLRGQNCQQDLGAPRNPFFCFLECVIYQPGWLNRWPHLVSTSAGATHSLGSRVWAPGQEGLKPLEPRTLRLCIKALAVHLPDLGRTCDKKLSALPLRPLFFYPEDLSVSISAFFF